MKKIILIIGILTLNGCASLKGQVFNKVHKGDTEAQLIEVLGEPDQMGPSKDGAGTEYYYVRRGDLCGFFVKDNVVQEVGCWDRPGYVSPLQAVGKGMQAWGNSMSASRREPANRPVNCTSNVMGNQLQTTCY